MSARNIAAGSEKLLRLMRDPTSETLKTRWCVHFSCHGCSIHLLLLGRKSHAPTDGA
eukprot:COSAG01_NODE_31904_length_589_cov_2.195918_2_plen_56_part_01